jgi:hypothetical protein
LAVECEQLNMRALLKVQGGREAQSAPTLICTSPLPSVLEQNDFRSTAASWLTDSCCIAWYMSLCCSQATILVNRGWVPPYWRSLWSEVHQSRQPAPLVTVEGVVQCSENPSSFVPTNNPAEGNYYWLDVPGIVSSRCLVGNSKPVTARQRQDSGSST